MATFSCDVCGEEFSNNKAKCAHVKVAHSELFIEKCELCGETFTDLGRVFSHVSKKHKDYGFENYYNEFIYGTLICAYDLCDVVLTANDRFSGFYCCEKHYKQQKKLLTNAPMNFVCSICNAGYETRGGLQRHIVESHTDVSIKDYYDEHFRSDGEGFCLYCGTELGFNGFSEGYSRFCYNTDCNVRWHNENTDRMEKFSNSIKETVKNNKNRQSTTLQYYIDRGMTHSEATRALADRQRTFSKAKCIEKYGHEEGHERFVLRQERWNSSFVRQNYSNVSQRLYWELYHKVKDQFGAIYFATIKNGVDDTGTRQNHEFKIRTNKTLRWLDFYIPEIGAVIEFDGTYWHSENVANGSNRVTDKERDAEIIEAHPHIKIHHVSEKDFKDRPDIVVQRCLDFIKSCKGLCEKTRENNRVV